MDTTHFYEVLLNRFRLLPVVQQAIRNDEAVMIRAITGKEAIGTVERDDYPILAGKEVMIECTFKNAKGQAFTSVPMDYQGSLKGLIDTFDASDARMCACLVATINAVMGSRGLCSRTVHCKDDGPKKCGALAAAYIREQYGDPKVLLVGYQPSLLENLSKSVSDLRVLDLNPDNIGCVKNGVQIDDGADDMQRDQLIKWAELILCTGSTVCNGTIVDYIGLDKDTLFYGTSAAGVAELLDLKRLCFADCVS